MTLRCEIQSNFELKMNTNVSSVSTRQSTAFKQNKSVHVSRARVCMCVCVYVRMNVNECECAVLCDSELALGVRSMKGASISFTSSAVDVIRWCSMKARTCTWAIVLAALTLAVNPLLFGARREWIGTSCHHSRCQQRCGQWQLTQP